MGCKDRYGEEGTGNHTVTHTHNRPHPRTHTRAGPSIRQGTCAYSTGRGLTRNQRKQQKGGASVLYEHKILGGVELRGT